jgi:hypothetical protein
MPRAKQIQNTPIPARRTRIPIIVSIAHLRLLVGRQRTRELPAAGAGESHLVV